MDNDAVFLGIKNNVRTIPGLIAYHFMPHSVGDVPCLFPAATDVDFAQAMKRGQDRLDITLTLLLNKVDDLSSSALMNGYMSGSGTYSLKAAIMSDRQLGGACDDLFVSGIRGNRFIEHAGILYLGAQVSMYVIGRGAPA